MISWYYIEGILIQSCYTLLIVLGLSILTGYTGMFSFGHAGFVCIGAYISVLCTMGFGLPYGLALLVAGLVAMVFGAALGKITLGLKGDYFCIATLGVGEAIRLIFNNLNLNLNIGGKQFVLDGAKGIASIPLHTTLPVALVIVGKHPSAYDFAGCAGHRGHLPDRHGPADEFQARPQHAGRSRG